ncbi:hypothetical protein ACFLX5_01660 [Chloroflexota bacterium]
MALGLSFIPLVILILRRLMHDLRGPALLFLTFLFLLFMHPPTMAVISVMAVVHFLLFSLPGRGREGSRVRQSAVGLALLFPVYVIMYFWAPSFRDFILEEGGDTGAHLALPPIWDAVPLFGYVPVALFVLGAGIMVHRGRREDLALVLTAAGLVAFEQIYPRFYIGPDIVYERGWQYTYVLMALMGGVVLGELWGLGRRAIAFIPPAPALASVLAVAAFAFGLRGHLSEPNYHVIGDAMYEDFLWVGENLDTRYQVAVLDTGLA